MNVLGVIPARGGSKGIPRKNLAPLAGRPLVAYSCDAALAAERLSRVLVSTDDPEIAEVCRAHGVEAPFTRPAELSADETPMVDVLRHAVSACAAQGWQADVVVLLQPTSPLRRPEHVDRAVELLVDAAADTVVSVVRVPHRFEASSLMRLEADGRLVLVGEGPPVLRRQDKPVLFARNGPAVLAVRAPLVEAGRLYGEVIRPLEMSAADSVDVDDMEDLALAEFWLSRSAAEKRS
jgi:CMP-N-acetylneuraminic acid synthetase